jgi:hypothetical protein
MAMRPYDGSASRSPVGAAEVDRRVRMNIDLLHWIRHSHVILIFQDPTKL